jgi:diaminopimelate decarboxylase/aspartate kinase
VLVKKVISEAEFDTGAVLGAPEHIADSSWVVMKFGGTSVSTAGNWATIAGLVKNRIADGLKPVIVHSALQGVSSALDALLDAAITVDPQDGLAAIRQRHFELAEDLKLDGPALLGGLLLELKQLIAEVSRDREVGVRTRVRVMALGELMSTRLGAAYLQTAGIQVEWLDARDLLTSTGRDGGQQARNFLSATCDYAVDEKLRETLASSGKVILTQGFIARNAQGQTVLLGRGGSDTSAAYLAARLQARRLEIWTDVPGMFTADPRVVPSARLLVALRYDEAQELASAGSAVLHPRCLAPLRHYGIPLFVRCTTMPEIAGTVMSPVTGENEPQVKGICMRNGLTLVSMETMAMWREVGFLARAFAVFSKHGLSIDLVSTSESNVTVSTDTDDGMLPDATRDALVKDLEVFCRVRVIPKCSTVSLVGRKIRTFLSRLAPAFEVFEEEKIHMMSQASNDLNLSFVIDEDQGARLISRLHASIIRKSGGSPAFGPSWEKLFHGDTAVVHSADSWWMQKREQLLDVAKHQLNAYVYDKESVRLAARSLCDLSSVDRVLYAVKANFNAELLEALDEEGVGFECVSPGEIEWLEQVLPNLDLSRILFTPNFAPRDEYAWGLKKGLLVTLDNLYPLEAWPELFKDQKIFVRLDPGQGRGHHEHVKTAGVHSKFGIPLFEIDDLKRLVDKIGATVVGIHAHSGSGILDPDNWRVVASELINVAQRFPAVTTIDLGGGFGIPEKPGDKAIDIARLDSLLGEIKERYPQYDLWLEPGRYIVAQAGVLLTRVTQTKGKGDMRYVGVGTGMNSLIRPALYGSYHEIVNLTRADVTARETVTVVGPICEIGDRLGSDRLLPPSEEGDVILIANTGAYGYVMSSQYNRREVAPEVVI